MDKHSWVFAILEYNHEFEVNISIQHETILPKRLGDKSITSIANSIYDLVTYLKAMNRIRMAHRVNSLSKICSADGKEIDGRFWGNNTNDIICNGCECQDKVITTKIDYRAWRNFLKLICQDNNRVLVIPLWKWIQQDSLWITECFFFRQRYTQPLTPGYIWDLEELFSKDT